MKSVHLTGQNVMIIPKQITFFIIHHKNHPLPLMTAEEICQGIQENILYLMQACDIL